MATKSGEGMRSHAAQRILLHAGILAAAVLAAYANNCLQIKEVNEYRDRRAEVTEVIDDYAEARQFGISLRSATPEARARLSGLNSGLKPLEQSAGQYQVMANELTLRDAPNGKIIGRKKMSDVVSISDSISLDDVVWGKTDNGFIALSEGNKLYAEKTLKTNAVTTQGAVNLLERLVVTEATSYSPDYPENDYETAIGNIIKVVDNRALSGLFPQTFLGVITSESQWQGYFVEGAIKLLKSGANYRTDKLSLDELMGYYGARGAENTGLGNSVRKKLEAIERVVQKYLRGEKISDLPADTIFFDNMPGKQKRILGSRKDVYDPDSGRYMYSIIYAGQDPESIPFERRHDYYRRVADPKLKSAS